MADELPADLRARAKDLPTVRIESDRDVDLEYLADSMEIAGLGVSLYGASLEKWRLACESPCGDRQFRRAIFRVSGDGVTTSEAFSLPKRADRITLHVSAGSAAVRAAGWAVLGFGLAFTAAGSIALALSPEYGPVDAQNPVALGGAIPAGIGVSLLLTSIPLFVKSRTLVTVERN